MKYTAYACRACTDAMFLPAAGSAAYTGPEADSIAQVEKAQLLNPLLWSLFVKQFRIGNVDDTTNGWRSEYWGKMMRGACFTYAYTQNEALYTTLENTVRDLLSTQDRYGRITTYSVPHEFHGWDVWGRKYVMLGLEYFLEICTDDALADQVIAGICRQADYLIEKIHTDAVGKMPITNTSEAWNGLNASSILEPFVRLYHLTSQQKYLDFARDIIDAGGIKGFNIYEAALEGKLHPYEFPVTKAYEMISNFEGIIEYYRATGEEKYKTMAVNFARLVMESDITVIGSAGTTHELFDHSQVRQFNPAFNGIMQETCVTVTWMKFCQQLLCLTGNPVYADQIETSIYNGLMGALNVNRHVSYGKIWTSEGAHLSAGQVFAFDSYSPSLNGRRGRQVGGYMELIHNQMGYGCCVAIGAAGTGMIAQTATMPARDGVAVNLYLPGTSHTALPDGNTVTLHTVTDYPQQGEIRMTVAPVHEAEFSIRLRIPVWSTQTVLTINGEPVDAQPGSYAVLHRCWHAGDTIVLTLDMRTRILRAAALDPHADAASICHAALLRGPIVLARDSQLGEDVTEAVTLVDHNGYAAVTPAGNAPFACRQHYRVQTAEGSIGVVDYASCGQNWEENMPVTAWITTK